MMMGLERENGRERMLWVETGDQIEFGCFAGGMVYVTGLKLAVALLSLLCMLPTLCVCMENI